MRRFADVIFAFSLGNEIRSDIVRWHGARAVSRFMGDLYELGKSIAPDSLFTYSNYPSSEYLDLSFLDFICFNVYLHREPDFRRYLTHLMAATGERPLVLSETGMDTIREGEAHQAELLTWQARASLRARALGFHRVRLHRRMAYRRRRYQRLGFRPGDARTHPQTRFRRGRRGLQEARCRRR